MNNWYLEYWNNSTDKLVKTRLMSYDEAIRKQTIAKSNGHTNVRIIMKGKK